MLSSRGGEGDAAAMETIGASLARHGRRIELIRKKSSASIAGRKRSPSRDVRPLGL